MSKEEQIIAKIQEIFKNKVQGIVTGGGMLIVDFQEAQIKIEDYETLTIEEIIEEIKKGL